MQSEAMSDLERQEIRRALLRHCEPDTLAMVMTNEAWVDLFHRMLTKAHGSGFGWSDWESGLLWGFCPSLDPYGFLRGGWVARIPVTSRGLALNS